MSQSKSLQSLTPPQLSCEASVCRAVQCNSHPLVTPYDLHLHFALQPHGAPSLRCLTESNFSQTMQNKPLTSSGGAGSPPPPVLPAPKHNAALVCLGFLHSSSFHLSLDFPSGRQHTHSLQLASCPRRYLQIRGCQQADTLPQWLLYPP